MELYLSTILEMAVHWTPRELMPCDGRKLAVRDHQALFSLIGNYYGGDGYNDFALPDLRPVDANGHKRPWEPNETRKFIVTEGLYPNRAD
jgi:microcystin-dependent protein